MFLLLPLLFLFLFLFLIIVIVIILYIFMVDIFPIFYRECSVRCMSIDTSLCSTIMYVSCIVPAFVCMFVPFGPVQRQWVELRSGFWMFDIWGLCRPQLLTLLMVTSGLIVKRFDGQRVVLSCLRNTFAFFGSKKSQFSIRPSREALDPKLTTGLIVKPFGACHTKRTGAD